MAYFRTGRSGKSTMSALTAICIPFPQPPAEPCDNSAHIHMAMATYLAVWCVSFLSICCVGWPGFNAHFCREISNWLRDSNLNGTE